MSVKQTVSLVLGGGGARGLAHIGVIEELTRNGLEIRAVAGTSMGALIGGIYAMGKLDVYTRWVTQLQRSDVFRLLDLSVGRNGLIKGDRIIGVLKAMIGDANIEDLPLHFTAVATDLETEQEQWFSDGPLFDAIRASISIPTIFTPHRYRGREYLDGSLVNPVPVAAAQGDQTDLTIAVSLSGRPDAAMMADIVQAEKQRNQQGRPRTAYQWRILQFIDEFRHHLEVPVPGTLGILDIVNKSMGIMENTIAHAQFNSHAPDLLIEIPRNAGNFYEFHRARQLIEIGRQRTAEVLKQGRDRHLARLSDR